MSDTTLFIPASAWGAQIKATAKLAGPVVVARAGMLVLAAVDTIMTGRAGADELASFGLGMAPQVSLLLVGIGFMMGTGVLVAQAFGAGEIGRCGAIWRVALVHAALLGLLMGALCLPGEWFLAMIGIEPALARGGGDVLIMFSWSMPAMLMYVATAAFLEAMGRPKPGMVVMLIANLLNVGLNWLMIYGHGGFPAMGANGAALATSIVRWLMFGLLIGYCFLWLPGRHAIGISTRAADWRAIGAKLRRLGLPLSIAQGLETTAFMAVTLLAGLLGSTAAAGYQVALNMVAMMFMCAIGLSSATAVHVGQAVGRGDQRGIRLAGWTGVGLVALAMLVLGLLIGSAAPALTAIYSPDPAVQTIATATLLVGAGFLVFDGAQAVLMGASRGVGDVLVPLLAQGIAFWLIAVPASWLFGLRWELGPPGLMAGLFVGVVISSLALAWRFAVVSRRTVRRL